MRRIAIFTDIHGNLDALEALYNDIKSEDISEVYHLGDAIAIGPEPKATLDFIIDRGIVSLMGNHEIYYTDIISTGSTNVHEGEMAHQRWVANQLGDSYFNIVRNFDFSIVLDVEGVKIYLCHYPYTMEVDKSNRFIEYYEKIDCALFVDESADLYIFGHHHIGGDTTDNNGIRYINLSSAGATIGNETNYAIIQVQGRSIEVTMKSVMYNKENVLTKMDKLEVPDRDFIKRIFFGCKC